MRKELFLFGIMMCLMTCSAMAESPNQKSKEAEKPQWEDFKPFGEMPSYPTRVPQIGNMRINDPAAANEENGALFFGGGGVGVLHWKKNTN